MHRYFFHSFPRRRAGETREVQISKGLEIAKGLLDNGILLTPENYEIPLIGSDGNAYDKLEATQRRACFTELEPEGLGDHSSVFGPFSLVYEIPNLRRLGALPVFYIPLQGPGDHLSGLATELLGGFVDATRLVSQLHAIRRHLSTSTGLGLTYRGKSVNFSPESIDAIRTFVDVLADGAGCDLDETQVKLGSFVSCFYPTENPNYTEPLHYYRQREWRLVGGSFTVGGKAWASPATPAQISSLLEIDPSFYGKQLSFYEPSKGVGAKVSDSIANRSHYIRYVDGLDVVGAASYLVIPDKSDIDTSLRRRFEGRGVKVIGEGDFRTTGT